MFAYETENSDLIPLDLVGFQMQVEMVSIGGVDRGVLRLVGVVHHAVLAIFYVGVHFHIVVGAEPGVQLLLAVGAPQDGTVQGAAVGKAVGHTADVDRAALTEIVGSHLHFPVPLHQHLGPLEGVDVLLALAKVDGLVGILQNEVVRVLVPIVLVVVEGEAVFLFHAQHAGQLEDVALIGMTGGLTHADEAAAVPDELPDCGGDLRVLPPDAAGVGGISIAHIDDDIQLIQQGGVLLDVLKLMNFTSKGAPDSISMTPE